MTNYKENLAELSAQTQRLFTNAGDTGKAFGQLHHTALASGALDLKTKELLALAIGIGIRCEGCIIAHTNGAIKAGATLDEITETINVAIMMGGGPSVVYGGKALDCAKELLS